VIIDDEDIAYGRQRQRKLDAHDLYKDGDPKIPKQVLDRNGQVVLGLCKRCGKAECELDQPCVVQPSAEVLK
jgi:hypothetical protein